MSGVNQDFTTARYRELLASAAQRFRFVRFGTDVPEEDTALWRHDIDFSPQRALALARLEHAAGIAATYFVQLSSRYYGAFEPETAAALREIASLGHDIGLHFDPVVVSHRAAPDYDARLGFEAAALASLVEAPVGAFSLHNPTTIVGSSLDGRSHAGLLNASHPSLRDRFTYVSDSNGLWRHRSLHDAIADPEVHRLYALTHPEWWQDDVMPPRQRIQRCLDGRAEAGGRHYDGLLARHGRPNVGEKAGRR
jgi:hypothetical protein